MTSLSTSPLRYPGGKQVLTNVLAHLIRLNQKQHATYAEPYAGGAGAALALLFGEHVERISINDRDPRIFALWHSILTDTSRFVSKIQRAKLDVPEWRRQRAIYLSPKRHSLLSVGFATFFLNRCNRSGIIARAGPIGGLRQTGKWKIDARFNREGLIERVERIADYRARISLSNLDALRFLKRIDAKTSAKDHFVYLDPPYFEKGRDLYSNYYFDKDHNALAKYLTGAVAFSWILTYDNAPTIRKLYTPLRIIDFDLDYSARKRRIGTELLVVKPGLALPSGWSRRIPSKFIGLSPSGQLAA